MFFPRRVRLSALLWALALLSAGCGQSGPLYFSEQPGAEMETVETLETVEIEQPEAKQSE